MLDMKIRKVGNSLGVALPQEVLSRLNVQDGDKVFLTEAPEVATGSRPMTPNLKNSSKLGKSLWRNTLRALAK